ncbi:MAG: PDDEXK nuclease domain-containing protein [Patescibacteria group bacterium]
MYVNYFDRKVKEKDENKTIGIVLCKENDHFVVEYTLPEDNNQIFTKQYQLYLPKKEELIEQIKKISGFKKCK